MATSGEFSKRVTDSTRAYERAHGDPIGQPCFHCGEPIPHRWRDSLSDPERYPYRLAFTVHHKDYENENNDPANLAPSHQHCNSGDRSPEGRARIKAAQQAAMTGRPRDPEVVARLRAGWTPERRARSAELLRATQRRRYRCGDCSLTTTPSALVQHQRHTGHEGRTRVA